MAQQIHPFPSLSPNSYALEGLSPRDRQLFCAYGAGPQATPMFSTITEAISHAARTYPNHIAATVVRPDGALDMNLAITYAELDRRATELAAILHTHGVSNGDAVCVFLSRGVPMLIAIVAALKVGACYVPQHVGVAPAHQLLRVAEACKARVVFTLSNMLKKLPTFEEGITVIAVDDVEGMHGAHVTPLAPFYGPKRPVLPSDRCYIIFTSGTTGMPKGVQVTHGNVANVILTAPMNLGLGPGKRIPQILSIAFDMGAWEILSALSHSATLIIRGRDISAAVKHADVVISTPTVLGTLDVSQLTHVQTVAVAGEPCPRSLAASWAKFATFYNACGPTEVTIINTAKKFDSSEEVFSIGSPTPNNTVYVLDPETMEPCKIGEAGEMWGGGLCVSAGYLNNESLTHQRYLPDPFVDSTGGYSWRMYRTGDLGRWNQKGELEHMGRVDDQVKVKGFRVELDGVSSVIEQTDGVTKAVVLKVNESLVAWVTPKNANIPSIKKGVSSALPYYCMPSSVICLDNFPKTGNGKVDKRALHSLLSDTNKSTEVLCTTMGNRNPREAPNYNNVDIVDRLRFVVPYRSIFFRLLLFVLRP